MISFKKCSDFAFWSTELVFKIFDDFGPTRQKRLTAVRQNWILAYDGYELIDSQIRERAR